MKKAITEFEVTHTLCERYYLDKDGKQRVQRTLMTNDEMVASEDFGANTQEGSLRLFVRWIQNAYVNGSTENIEMIKESPRTNGLSFTVVAIAVVVIVALLLTLALWMLMS